MTSSRHSNVKKVREHKVYGYYECECCHNLWESPFTFVRSSEQGNKEVINQQSCLHCKHSTIAYKTEELRKFYGFYKCKHCYDLWGSEFTYFRITKKGKKFLVSKPLNCPQCLQATIPFKTEECRKVYGFYKCKSKYCNNSWKSAFTFIRITKKGKKFTIYKQRCLQCNRSTSAYKVQELRCPKCGKLKRDCDCPPNEDDKPHIKELCGRCSHLKYSCVPKKYEFKSNQNLKKKKKNINNRK
jgi:hypothetical protein